LDVVAVTTMQPCRGRCVRSSVRFRSTMRAGSTAISPTVGAGLQDHRAGERVVSGPAGETDHRSAAMTANMRKSPRDWTTAHRA